MKRLVIQTVRQLPEGEIPPELVTAMQRVYPISVMVALLGKGTAVWDSDGVRTELSIKGE